MRQDEMISRHEHELEVSRLARTIERLNAELSALAAYLITARPMQSWAETERATALAAKVGCLSKRDAEESIQRIQDAVAFSAHAA